MQSFVALLRGINVGGNNAVKMGALRKLCVAMGWQDVHSYVASGNLVFRADGTADDLAAALHDQMAAAFGVDVSVLVLTDEAVRAIVAGCPHPRDAGKAVHGVLCFDPPVVDQAALAKYRALTESLLVEGNTVWLHTPDGYGRSKLATHLDKVVTGTKTTARNLNTLQKLTEMLDAL